MRKLLHLKLREIKGVNSRLAAFGDFVLSAPNYTGRRVYGGIYEPGSDRSESGE